MADEEETTGQVWAIKMDGQVIAIQDLPVGIIDRVARTHGITWTQVVLSPCSDLSVAISLLEAVADHLGTTEPTGLTVKTLVPFFSQVPDDVPDSPEAPEEPENPFGPNG